MDGLGRKYLKIKEKSEQKKAKGCSLQGETKSANLVERIGGE